MFEWLTISSLSAKQIGISTGSDRERFAGKQRMKKILGISAFYHDSAAALVIGDNIVAAAQEERFTREKHTPDFPVQAIQYCLDEAGLTIDELDAIVFYDKPFLKFERHQP